MATTLEHQFTKDEILAYYLNIIYLGNNIYGVQAAAQTYWGMDVSKLDWAQGALLAALIRNPNGYDPITIPRKPGPQRRIALERLVATGRIDKATAAKANREPLPNKVTRKVPAVDYFVEQVRRRLLNADGSFDGDPLGTALGRTPAQRASTPSTGGGLRIYTTYDPLMQQQAVQARQSTVPGIQPDGRIPRHRRRTVKTRERRRPSHRGALDRRGAGPAGRARVHQEQSGRLRGPKFVQ